MPPKAKVDDKPVLQPDADPYGVFFNVDVQDARLNFESTTSSDGVPLALPTVHLSLSYPGPYAAVVGSPLTPDAASPGIYHINFQQRFRQNYGVDALSALLNATTILALHDSTSGSILASAPLDFTDFALGQSSITLTNLLLEPAPLQPSAPTDTAAAPKPGSKPATPQGGKKGIPEAAPAAALPAAMAKLLGPAVLPTVTIHLTHRPAPAAEGGAAAQAAGTEAPGKSATPPASAAAATGDDVASALAEPEPYSYFSGPDTQQSNVITLELVDAGPSPLPQGLLAAHAAGPGRVSLSAALVLPAGAGQPLVLAGAPLTQSPTPVDGSAAAGITVGWPGAGKLCRVMTPSEAQGLLDALDQCEPSQAVVGVELVRTVAEDKATGDTQSTWDAYHAWAPLPEASCLLEGGSSAVTLQTTMAAGTAGINYVALQPWPADVASALPAFAPPAGKLKPVEELAAGSPSPWVAAGSTLSVKISFARPLVPPWSPPPEPTPSLQELIPQRVLHPAPPPSTPEQDLDNAISSVLTQLAAAYRQHQAQQGQEAGHAQGPPEVVHKALIRELNKSGKYLAWRDGLKVPLVRMVRERLGKSGSMASAEMCGSLSGLHDQLLGAANAAIRVAGDDRPKPPPEFPAAPSEGELQALALLAEECEAVDGDARRATALLRRRQRDKDNVKVHLDIARLNCCGLGAEAARAADALRLALEIDPTDIEALTTAAAIHTSQLLAGAAARPEDAAPADAAAGQQQDPHPSLARALAAGHALLRSDRTNTTAWCLLYIAYTASLQQESAAACLYELKRQQRAVLAAHARADSEAQAAAATAATQAQLPAITENETAEVQPAVASPDAASTDATSTKAIPATAGLPPLGFLLPTWHLSVQLGLAPLAAELMQQCMGAFARTSSREPVAMALLTARTHLLLTTHSQPRDSEGSTEQPESSLQKHLDAACAAVRRTRKAVKSLSVGVTLGDSDQDSGGTLTPAQLTRLQLVPSLLLGDIEWARAQAATALMSLSNSGSRQEYLARRAEARRLVQRHHTEARRAYQEVLQQLYDQGWLTADAVAAAATSQPLSEGHPAVPACGVAHTLFHSNTPGGAHAAALAAAVSESELKRGLLRLAVSYLDSEALPDCALDVATAAVALWPASPACWSTAARAAAASQDETTRTCTAQFAWTQANMCDRWDARTWEALALHAFRHGRYEQGVAALRYVLALHQSITQDPDKSIAVAPKDPVTVIQAAAEVCSSVAGDYEQAVRHLTEALSLPGGEETFQVRHQLAQMSAKLGDTARAREQSRAAWHLAKTPLEQQQARQLRDQLAAA